MTDRLNKTDNGIALLMHHMSLRMLTVAELCTKGSSVADIGTDHGYVPIYLFLKGISGHIIAADVRKGPLERAEANIREYGADISVRLSDGLKGLDKGDAETVICAGMGGLLIRDIISAQDPAELGVKELILQPQSEIAALRQFLRQKHYYITDERFLSEEGKYYFVIKAAVTLSGGEESCRGQSCREESDREEHCYEDTDEKAVKMLLALGCGRAEALRICDRFGPCLLLEKDILLKEYMENGLDKCDKILEKLQKCSNDSDREKEILEEKKDLLTALEIYNCVLQAGEHA